MLCWRKKRKGGGVDRGEGSEKVGGLHQHFR